MNLPGYNPMKKNLISIHRIRKVFLTGRYPNLQQGHHNQGRSNPTAGKNSMNKRCPVILKLEERFV
jgi:hypothetical protein